MTNLLSNDLTFEQSSSDCSTPEYVEHEDLSSIWDNLPDYEKDIAHSNGSILPNYSDINHDCVNKTLKSISFEKRKKSKLTIQVSLKSKNAYYSVGNCIKGTVLLKNNSSTTVELKLLRVSLHCQLGLKHALGYRATRSILILVDYASSFNYWNRLEGLKLEPGEVYKGEVNFTLPFLNLDSCCKHLINSHKTLPPSFGINHQLHSHDDKNFLKRLNDHVSSGQHCTYFIQIDSIEKQIEETNTNTFYAHNTHKHCFRVFQKQHNSYQDQSTFDQFKHIAELSNSIINEFRTKSIAEKEIFGIGKQYQFNAENTLHLIEFEYRSSFNKKLSTLFVELQDYTDLNLNSFIFKDINASFNKNGFFTLKLIHKFEKQFINNNLPQSIRLKPVLTAINIQSLTSIPIEFDSEFSKFPHFAMKKMIETFKLYYIQMHHIFKENTKEKNDIVQLVRDIGDCEIEEIVIPDFFESKEVVVKNLWTPVESTKIFECTITVPLIKNIEIIKTMDVLLPTFQTCNFARLYRIDLQIEPCTQKSKTLSIPLTII